MDTKDRVCFMSILAALGVIDWVTGWYTHWQLRTLQFEYLAVLTLFHAAAAAGIVALVYFAVAEWAGRRRRASPPERKYVKASLLWRAALLVTLGILAYTIHQAARTGSPVVQKLFNR